MPGVEVEGGEALGEAPVPMGAQLYQQEAGTAAQIPGHRADDIAKDKLFML